MNKHEQSAIGKLAAELKEVRDAILGDEFQPNGLLSKQVYIDRRLSRLERIVENGKWFFYGACLLSTHSLYEIIQKLLAL